MAGLRQPTETLLGIRHKWEQKRLLSRAEWVVLAHYLQLGCEGTYEDLEAPSRESYADVLEAFEALLALRPGGSQRDPYYLGNLGPLPAADHQQSRGEAVTRSVQQLIRTLREPGPTTRPVFAARNLYVALRDEDLQDIATVNHALLPHLPVLFRLAARGHWLREQRPVRPRRESQDYGFRSSVFPQIAAGDFRLSLLLTAEQDLTMAIEMVSRDVIYPFASYPQIREFATMLSRVKTSRHWRGREFFGYTNATVIFRWERADALALDSSPSLPRVLQQGRRLAELYLVGPFDQPVHLAGLLVLLLATLIQFYRYQRVWTPLQRYYLSSYLRNHVLNGLGIRTGRYALAIVRDNKGARPAVNADIVAAPAAKLALSQESRQAGVIELVFDSAGRYDNAGINTYLSEWVYDQQSLRALLRPLLLGGLAALGLGLTAALQNQWERFRLRRYGRQCNGPEWLRTAAFNRRIEVPGIALATGERPGWSDRLLRRDCRQVRISRELENQHLLLMGDTGTGKSQLIRQILLQVAARQETAVVYDPVLELTPEFYDPGRGDRILNPLDERVPYWDLPAELTHEAEAVTLASSLYPSLPRKDLLLSHALRSIVAHLLTRAPTVAELSRWLCREEELERQLAGTPLAARLVSPQREALLGELKAVGRVLRLLPATRDGREAWNSRQWSGERRGWLFLTSTPQTREWLSPLPSFWLDLLVMRLMNQGMAGVRPVWFMLDHLATLRLLPQLQGAIVESHKSTNRFVLGVNRLSQLEESWGTTAKEMLSQTATQVFLRTTEVETAGWISETLGEVEIERLRQSENRWYKWRQRPADQFDRQTQRLVTTSQIRALAPRQGFLKSENRVVRLSFPRFELPHKQPAVLERKLERGLSLPLAAQVLHPGSQPGKGLQPAAVKHSPNQAAGARPPRPFFT